MVSITKNTPLVNGMNGRARGYVPYADLTDDQRVMVDSESADDRARAAVFGWGIDKLADDESDMVADTAWKYMEKHGIKPYEWEKAI